MERPAIEKTIFVSYSKEDAGALVTKIWEFALGKLNVQYDDGFMVPGANWRTQIEKRIARADAFMFIISSGSVLSFSESSTSPFCAWEAECAIRLQKNIIPVLWEETPDIDLLPSEISDLHRVSFQEYRLSNFKDENSFGIAFDRLWLGLHAEEALWSSESREWYKRLEDWLENNEHVDFLLSELEMRKFELFLSKTPQSMGHIMDHPEMKRYIRINRRDRT